MEFRKLTKLKDVRHSLTHNGAYINDGINAKTDIAIHHSLTKQSANGSSAEGYARYHVNTLGWPGIGYHFVIETDGTIKWCHDVGLRSYHVGNSNRFAVGICVTGDFRTEELTDAQEESLVALVGALKRDLPNYKRTRGHNEFDGYSWKECPEFDYRAVITKQEKIAAVAPTLLPNTYVIQEGDTFWSIANELKGVSIKDIIMANLSVDPTKLRVGQTINIAAVKKVEVTPEVSLPTGVYRKGDKGNAVKQIQTALNAAYFKCGKVDGAYGPATEDAIKRFQSVHLPREVDGVYGPKTRAKLLEVIR
jgi:N-acetylmuramoyl-L-alanine amidase